MGTAWYGTLKARTSVSGYGSYASSQATISQWFSDSLSVDAPGLTGTTGTVLIPFAFNYDIIRSYAGVGASLVVRIQSSTSSTGITRSVIGGTDNGSDLPFTFVATLNGADVPFSTLFYIPFEFTYGENINIYVQAQIGASGNTDTSHSSYSGVVNFTNSAHWGGFQSVLDSEGNIVTNYTTSSASGTDWSINQIPAVPEPSTYAMLLAGLSLIAVYSNFNLKAAKS
jgi:hypothetical protein